jgi:acid phosphatase (class A)
MKASRFATLLAALLLAAAAPAGQVETDNSFDAQNRGGYLSADAIDAVKFLPPPPTPGSAAQAADQDIFIRTRALKDGARWNLAQSDDKLDTDALLADFSCALGLALDRRHAPKLAALFDKARRDAGAAIASGKKFYKRPRPLIGNDAPICVDRTVYEKSTSYPSGHSTLGWTLTLILAQAAPDRANEIAARGRAFGESRVVCGVHWASDVEAGRLAATVVFAALQGSAAYRADMSAARREIAPLRRTAPRPDGAACTAQNAAAARPW